VCWDYDIYEQPYAAPASTSPDDHNPANDNPHLKNPHLDNKAQLNTKEVNTNKLNTYKSNTTWQAFENQPLHQRISDYSYAEGEVL
jgi:hypothetical protein